MTLPRSFAGLPLQKAGELSFSFNLLIYGDAGVGKTHLAGSADAVPAMRKVLHLDCESGANTLKKAWPNVEVVSINSWKDLEQVYQALFAGAHEYKTVIVDSLTELNDYCIDGVAKEAMLRKPDSFDDVLEIRDWNKVTSRMIRMIRVFRDLPMNTIFVAHMVEEKDPRTSRLLKQPLLSGQLKKKLPAIPDIVLYQYMQEVEEKQRRLVLTQKTDTCVAKARGVEMPMVLGYTEDVDMQLLYNYIELAKKVGTAS